MKMFYKFSICCLFIFSLPVNAAFECYSGRPACLQSNDKVVSSNAECFSSGTCGWGGFVCKSDYEEVVDMYDRLVSNYDDLESEYEYLRSEYNDLVERYNELLNQ